MRHKPIERILILTSRCGAGHWQAASTINDVISLKKLPYETIIFDPMVECHPLLGSLSQKLFIGGVKKFPSAYHYIFEKTRQDNYLSTMLKSVNRIGLPRFFRQIKAIGPTLIVCTDPTSACMVSLLKQRGLVNVPVVTVITDYSIHSYWVNEETDHYIVGSEKVREGLRYFGVNDRQISVTGIPVHPKFYQAFDLPQLRRKYDLNAGMPTVFITGGGYGILGKDISVMQLLEQVPFPIQVIFVCGHNRALYEQIKGELGRTKHRVILKGFVDSVNELMAVSDLVITKAGGLTTSEAIALKLPMVLLHSLGGHEQDNVNYLLENQTALLADHAEDLYKKVTQILTNPSLRGAMKRNIAYLQTKEAAFDAVAVIQNVLAAQSEWHRFKAMSHVGSNR